MHDVFVQLQSIFNSTNINQGQSYPIFGFWLKLLSYYIIHRHIYLYSYIYVRVFLQISASLHDNAKLARVGVARAAPAHGLTELFLIKYFALLYVRSNITLHDPFLRIIIWTT